MLLFLSSFCPLLVMLQFSVCMGASIRGRSLSTEVTGGDPSENIFAPSNYYSGGTTDNNTVSIVTCVRPNEYGEYGADTPYSNSVIVSWVYQIQGLMEMTAATVRDLVVPAIEEKLAAKLVQRLFDNTVCSTGQQINQSVNQLVQQYHGSSRRQRKLLNIWTLDNGAQVTGLLSVPKDTILNGNDGVLCQNVSSIKEAKRCFRLIGAITLTGINGDIQEASSLAQEAIRSIINDDQTLNNAYVSVRNVQYIAKIQDYRKYLGGQGQNTSTLMQYPTGVDGSSKSAASIIPANPSHWPIWSWIALGGVVVLVVVIALLLRQQFSQSKKTSFSRQLHRRKRRRFLIFSDDSVASVDEEEEDTSEDYRPSNAWRNAHLDLDAKSEGDAFPTMNYFDSKTEQLQDQSILTISFPSTSATASSSEDDTPQLGLAHSDHLASRANKKSRAPDAAILGISFGASSGYGSSSYGSSLCSPDTTDEDSDDGNSSRESPPEPRSGRSWRRSVI